MFELKPSDFNKFWDTNGAPPAVVAALRGGTREKSFSNARKVFKQFQLAPQTWPECVALARIKFEKYFNHKARQLLVLLPLDTKVKDGSLFWKSPKRPPTPAMYSNDDSTHLGFVTACARLFSDVFGVPRTPADLLPANVCCSSLFS